MDLKNILSSLGTVILLFLVVICCPSGINAQQKPDSLALHQPAPDSVFQVVFETTKGSFTITAHRNWSPLGADRLYHLVRLNYYRNVPFYRVVPDRFAQFGLAEDLDITEAWADHPIADEPVRKSNTYGRIHFARSGPKTRSQHLSIMLGNNTYLDTVQANGVTGFVPIGEVTKGMDVVESMYSEYGNEPLTKFDSLMTHGNTYLERHYPELDYIQRAYIKKQ
jgi:cyclophilin family peptidyl-prolyl cis-trans isomerase